MMGNDKFPINQEVVNFIKKEAAAESQGTISNQPLARHLPRKRIQGASGAPISSHEFKKASEILEKVKDGTLRKSVINTFLITTKYQALNMLINENSHLRKTHPGVLTELVDEITKTDRKLQGKAERAVGTNGL